MDQDSQELLTTYVIGIFFGLGVGSFVSWLAYKWDFYRLPPVHSVSIAKNIPSSIVFFAFLLFFTVELLIVPSLFSLFASEMSGEVRNWSHMIGSILLAIVLGIYCCCLKKTIFSTVWGDFKHCISHLCVGALTWFVVYPWVMTIGALISFFLLLFGNTSHLEQVAVTQVKEALQQPTLSFITIFVVVTIVPFIEELLFRGFLQTWLKGWVNRFSAILITSFIFALFHFSPSQGIQNSEFLLALFILSCYLGFLRERRASLWASIGLHSTFNAVTLIMLQQLEV